MTRISRWLDALVAGLVEVRPRMADLLALAMIALGVALHVAFIVLTPLSISPDEAHYWEWSRQPDFAYYSKGPLIALLIQAGTSLFGDTALGVRVLAVFFQALLQVVFYLVVRTWCLPGVSLLLLLAFRSTLMFTSIGLVATTDPPTAFLWLLAVAAALFGLKDPRWWTLAGLCVGVAFLAKYTSAILGCSLFCFVLGYRRDLLRSPWLYLGGLLAIACVLPILYWNSQNGWVNLAHNAAHVGAGRAVRFRLNGVFDLLGSQLGLYGLVLAPLLIGSGIGALRRFSSLNESARLLLFCALPVIALCLSVACFRRVYANWPMPAFVSLFLLLALQLRAFNVTTLKVLVAGTILNLFILLPAYAMFFGETFGVDGKYLPTKKLAGWARVGTHAQSLAANRDYFARTPIVMSENYDVLSAIVFAMPSHPQALCPVLDERRMNQYDLWGGWEEAKGADVLLVLKDAASATKLAPDFSVIENLPPYEGLPIYLGATEIRRFYFFLGRGFSGRPPSRAPLAR